MKKDETRTFVITVFLLVQIQVVYAVDNLRLTDIRTLGMGGNGVTQSALYNPALLTTSTGKTLHIDYINKYGLKELGTARIGFQHPNCLLPVGVDILSFGYDKYRENMFRLSFAKRLNKKWSLGLGIQYAFIQSELFETAPQQLSVDIGAIFSPVDKLFIGMLILDFPSVYLSKEDAEIKYITGYSIQIGFQWEVINSLLIVGTAESNREETITGSMGLEYAPFDKFRIRTGIQLSPLLPAFGVGYGFSHFIIDAAAVYHPVLGVSTGLGLKYTF